MVLDLDDKKADGLKLKGDFAKAYLEKMVKLQVDDQVQVHVEVQDQQE